MTRLGANPERRDAWKTPARNGLQLQGPEFRNPISPVGETPQRSISILGEFLFASD
jgi:hypothetical protein